MANERQVAKKSLAKPTFLCLNQTFSDPKNTGHLEWNALGDFSEFKTNGDSKEAL